MPDALHSVWELVLRLLLAAAAGMCVGWEREARNRPAGLRTHMLVALGACAFVLLAMQLHEQQIEDGEAPTWDVLRVVSGVVSGVGFLGAGAIFQASDRVRGLTTAAGIWVVAAMGAAAAVGSWWMLGTVLVVTLFVLAVLRRVERRAFGHEEEP
jgi:putative Mg2+ transporter-C (MgtC) family protein